MAEDWLADVRKYVTDADETVVGAIVRYCGIALQSRDSSLVAFSDATETDRVRENYLKKKLGLVHEDADLDAAIASVGDRMKEDRTKNRVTVYYLLAEHFGLLSLFGGAASSTGGAVAAGTAALGIAGAGIGAAVDARDIVVEPVHVASVPAAEPVAAYSSFDNDDDSKVGGLGWLKWLLLAALLVLVLFFVLRSCSGQEAALVEPEAEATAGETADATANPVDGNIDATATAPATAAPVGSGVVTGKIAGRPKLTVYFDTAKSAVTNDLATASAELKAYMTKNPTAKIAVSGYNDPTGNVALNSELSKKRAQAVAKALEDAGIPASAINLEKPAATTDAAVAAAEARRVEVVVKP